METGGNDVVMDSDEGIIEVEFSRPTYTLFILLLTSFMMAAVKTAHYIK